MTSNTKGKIEAVTFGLREYVLTPVDCVYVRFTAPDGRVYDVRLEGNALTVTAEQMVIRPRAANFVHILQANHGADPVTFVQGEGYVGGGPPPEPVSVRK